MRINEMLQEGLHSVSLNPFLIKVLLTVVMTRIYCYTYIYIYLVRNCLQNLVLWYRQTALMTHTLPPPMIIVIVMVEIIPVLQVEVGCMEHPLTCT